MNKFFARLSRPGLRDSLIFLALDCTEFYMNFYLNLTITKFYLYFHVPIALLTRQSKSTVTVQSKLGGRDSGVTGGAKPRQLPCED